MWLGYPGTSGASFMDYIVTDQTTSPLELACAYSEKLAYMPDTFFIGDHQQMFPHIQERAILKGSDQGDIGKDNVAVVNATNLGPIFEKGERKAYAVTAEVPHGPEKVVKMEEVVVPVVEIANTSAVENMVSQGHVTTSLEGVSLQNGLTTLTHTHTKAATGEEVPQTILVTTRQQYGLPETAVVYCNFNQLYKIDPDTMKMWCEVLRLYKNIGEI